MLRGIDTATIDLIATDPPFNKSRDFHATPDSLAAGAKFVDRWRWDKDVHQDWLESLKNDRPAVLAYLEAVRKVSGDDMGAFLCWLGVRLMECHRVLKPTGSLYLHIDHTCTRLCEGHARRGVRTQAVPQCDRMVLHGTGKHEALVPEKTRHDPVLREEQGRNSSTPTRCGCPTQRRHSSAGGTAKARAGSPAGS